MTTNDRLLGSVAPGEPARLLGEEEVESMVAQREQPDDNQELEEDER